MGPTKAKIIGEGPIMDPYESFNDLYVQTYKLLTWRPFDMLNVQKINNNKKPRKNVVNRSMVLTKKVALF